MPSQGVTNVANAIINKINNLISSHNNNSNAHQDIRNSIPKIFYAACDCSEQNELIELECEDWNTEQGNIIYVRFNNVDDHDSTHVMFLNINEEPIPVQNTIEFYNTTPLTLFRDAVVKFTCYFIDENTPIFLYEFSTLTSASNTTPSADTTSGTAGTGTTWARSDHTHPKSSIYAEASHTHSDTDITTFGFYTNLPQANCEGPSQQQVNFAINSAMGGKEDNANKVTSLSSSSTDTQYPSAKAVYDATFNLDILDCINENFTLLSLPQPIMFTYNEDSIDGTQEELFVSKLLTRYTEGAYVDWGDGTPIETYESYIFEHVYSDNVQEHTIIIYGEINQGDLGVGTFQDLTGLTSINIPSTVIKIGHNSFSRCTGLTSINLPKELTTIGVNVFQGCINLNTIILNWTETPLTYAMLMWGSPSTISPTFSIPYGTTSLYESKGYPTEKLVERSE